MPTGCGAGNTSTGPRAASGMTGIQAPGSPRTSLSVAAITAKLARNGTTRKALTFRPRGVVLTINATPIATSHSGSVTVANSIKPSAGWRWDEWCAWPIPTPTNA